MCCEKLGQVDLIRILWGDFSGNGNFEYGKLKYLWILLKNEAYISCIICVYCQMSKLRSFPVHMVILNSN